jgi:hypothetical protein
MLKSRATRSTAWAFDAMKPRAAESEGASIVITLAQVGVHHGRTACAASACA